MRTDKIKKFLLPNLPYLFIGWACLKVGTAYRLAAGADLAHKLVGMVAALGPAFADFAPGLNPFDWLAGIAGAVAIRLVIYQKSKKAQKYRRDEEYGSARWYVTADLNHYIDGHKKAYYEAVEAARVVQEFIDYAGPEKRTDLAARLAVGLGVSPQSFYRYQTQVLEANAWALKLEREDGLSRDYFRALALCRKPKAADTFPSLTPEQRALIENIWFDRRFAANLGTREMLYEKFEEIARERGWTDYPSAKTVGRYITYLMERPGAESARYLAANGTREWKNKMMVKCRRETHSLEVMEYVIGDEHTFDVWVQYTAPNGKVKAVRPKLVGWMDAKSRAIIGDVLCVDANGQTLKESLVKMIYTAGVPKILHIDNGKDYTKQELTGQNRKNRRIDFDFDAETVGFYQSIGIQEVGRSLPYQPWDKAIERFFGTVCSKFSK